VRSIRVNCLPLNFERPSSRKPRNLGHPDGHHADFKRVHIAYRAGLFDRLLDLGANQHLGSALELQFLFRGSED
jgi:hypothetical protein